MEADSHVSGSENVWAGTVLKKIVLASIDDYPWQIHMVCIHCFIQTFENGVFVMKHVVYRNDYSSDELLIMICNWENEGGAVVEIWHE